MNVTLERTLFAMEGSRSGAYLANWVTSELAKIVPAMLYDKIKRGTG